MPDIHVEDGAEVPLDAVDARILEHVLAYCTYFHDVRGIDVSEGDIDEWECRFVDMDVPTLFAVLNVRDVDFACVCERAYFGISGFLTREFRARNRLQTIWISRRCTNSC